MLFFPFCATQLFCFGILSLLQLQFEEEDKIRVIHKAFAENSGKYLLWWAEEPTYIIGGSRGKGRQAREGSLWIISFGNVSTASLNTKSNNIIFMLTLTQTQKQKFRVNKI